MVDAPTVAQRILELAHQAGADYVFANLGSDHPAFIEAFARLQEAGTGPQVVICPHEMTALSAAHGYAMVTGRAQLVLVHVDVGTANLGGSVHNIARSRLPALIIAGLAPVTLHGELIGSRSEFIHFLQDTPHQDDLVRPYVKWSYELRASASAAGALLRGRQIALSEPQGPVYLTGAREVWEAAVVAQSEDPSRYPPASLGALGDEDARRIAAALLQSRRALIITSYLGRRAAASQSLVALSERAALGVCEVAPQRMNFPGDHSHHLGYELGAHVEEADFILLLDVDVPWLPSKTRSASGARIFHIDCDPLKPALGHWHYPVEATYQADSGLALQQLGTLIADPVSGRDHRAAWLASLTQAVPAPMQQPTLTEASIGQALRELVTERTLCIVESPSGTVPIARALRPSRSGSFFGNGGTGLGWGINAAVGAKLADPRAEVVAVVGDGSYQFAVPSSTYWVARTYRTPFLTVIANNGGWNSPKHSTQLVHPSGAAHRAGKHWVTMTAGAKLAEIAAAAGEAASFQVTEPQQLSATLRAALDVVRHGHAAVVDVTLAAVSAQRLP